MTLKELPQGEGFRTNNNRHYKKCKPVPRHEDIWDCMDDEGRHVPFDGKVNVIPDQRRIEL